MQKEKTEKDSKISNPEKTQFISVHDQVQRVQRQYPSLRKTQVANFIWCMKMSLKSFSKYADCDCGWLRRIRHRLLNYFSVLIKKEWIMFYLLFHLVRANMLSFFNEQWALTKLGHEANFIHSRKLTPAPAIVGTIRNN